MRFIFAIQLFLICTLLQACSSNNIDFEQNQNLEIMLVSNTGQPLEQVSGLTNINGYLIFVAQKQNKLFYIDTDSALIAMRLKLKSLALKELPFTGALPEEASWEAITIAKINEQYRLFLSYEHLGHEVQGSFHKIFSSELQFKNRMPILGRLKPYSKSLPINAHLDVALAERTNFGYEAITWLASKNALLALPELEGQEALLIEEGGHAKTLGKLRHGLRISDLGEIQGERCLMAISFCYQADPVCQTNDGVSRLSLASLWVKSDHLAITDVYDISEQYLDIEALNNNSVGVYNGEGLTFDENILFMINDNKPGKGVGSVLRTLALPQPFASRCTDSPTS